MQNYKNIPDDPLDRCLSSALTHLQSAKRDLLEYEKWSRSFLYGESEVAKSLESCIDKATELLERFYNIDNLR